MNLSAAFDTQDGQQFAGRTTHLDSSLIVVAMARFPISGMTGRLRILPAPICAGEHIVAAECRVGRIISPDSSSLATSDTATRVTAQVEFHIEQWHSNHDRIFKAQPHGV